MKKEVVLPKEIEDKLRDPLISKREIKTVYQFKKGEESFSAIYDAQEKAKKLGYKIGSMARDMPIALAKKADYIAKWYNIGMEDAHKIEGVLLSSYMREEDVYMVIFKK